MKKVLTTLFVFIFIFALTVPALANGQGNAHGHNNPHNPHYQGGNPGGGPGGGQGNGPGGGNPPPGPGGNPNHGGSTDITNNYYSSTEYSGTYNDMDVEQTYNYDVDNEYTYDYSQTENNAYSYAYSKTENNAYAYTYSHSATTNNYIDNSEVLNAISSMQDDYLHKHVMDSANATLGVSLTNNYPGIVTGPPSQGDPNALFNISANVSLNPAKLPLQLGPGEFAKLTIAVTADRPVVLRVTGSKSNMKVLVKEVIISEPYGVAYVPVVYTFKKGDYWSYGKVLFTNVYGEVIAKTEIICDNTYALDWASSLTTDSRYTSVGHGFRVNRGSWGISAFAGIKYDREANKHHNDDPLEGYATFNIDW